MILSSLVRRMPRWLRRTSLRPNSSVEAYKRCQLEPLERRSLMAADIHLGAVYFEEATGDDSAGDRIEVTFQGGQPGTQLTQIIIDTDKDGLGLSTGDLFFDTQSGGLGVFKSAGLNIEAPQGFSVVSTQVSDGGTRLVINLSGFDAGERLIFTVDVDEAQFVSGSNIDVNSLVEGGEFQRSKLTGTFTAPHYFDATGTGTFWDAYDTNFADAATKNGTQLGLPPDNYIPPDNADRTDRTAGAVVLIGQVARPVSLAGTVYHDVNLNNTRENGELGISGVVLQLWRKEANGTFTFTGTTTTTDAQGNYKFDALQQGVYGVVEAQPAQYFSVGAKVGTVDGGAVGRVESVDSMYDITLLGGQDGVHYDFAEAKQAELHGHVYYDANNNGVFDSGETGIGGAKVIIQYLPTTGAQPAAIEVFTNADGSWSATGLRPGAYRVTEVTPAGYLDGLDRAGDAGGTATNPGDLISGVFLAGGQIGRNYDFGELLPATLSGRVHADLNGDCIFQAGEPLLAGVQVQLLDGAGNLLQTATTDANGVYKFSNLAPGTYSVFEVQPSGYFDGGEEVGSAGGTVTGDDRVGGIVLGSGVNATGYDFCENVPVSISGFVYVDLNNNCSREQGETGIAGVTITLLDANGNSTGRTTTTDANGFYRFDGLAPGVYGVAEAQPSNYIDGQDCPGNAGGTAGNDRITGANLSPGVHGTEYNFGELIPSSISGRIHADKNGDCTFQEGEQWLAGVEVQLRDSAGNVIATTVTGSDGVYIFNGLAPGVYSVFEVQPAGYFDGGEQVGTAGGTVGGNDLITSIQLGPGVTATGYDFCENEPVSLSGYVYLDLDNDGVRDSGESGIAGVTLVLLDANGAPTTRTTTTDANGFYRFDGLAPGVYGVSEVHPTAYIDGLDAAGNAGGAAQNPGDIITGAQLNAGVHGVEYNFGELVPATIRGRVHGDLNGDCTYQDGELLLQGVEVRLLDAAGNILAKTFTGADGTYSFGGLAPGVYSVFEVQPGGYFDGGENVGSAGGTVGGNDLITGITLAAGVNAVDYNYCEKLPASIAGMVFSDINADTIYDAATGSTPIAGAVIELLDSAGNVIATTTTDANGAYRFTGLAPGVYGVREQQPAGYFDGDEVVGNAGGRLGGNDLMVEIELTSGENGVEYNFAELPPATLSGYVYQDGPTIMLQQGETLDVGSVRDGQRTSDDTPLAGVKLRLTDEFGNALTDTFGNVIETTTDASGYYQFTGLRQGRYGVVQVQPDGYIDGIDTAGTLGGAASNGQPVAVGASVDLFSPTIYPPNSDAIYGIQVYYGQFGIEYNFSEVITAQTPPPIIPNPPFIPPMLPQNLALPFPRPLGAPSPGQGPHAPNLVPLPSEGGGGGGVPYSWHLSVIDAGYPRGRSETQTPDVRFTGMQSELYAWRKNAEMLGKSRWTVRRESPARDVQIVFGAPGCIPVTGDFNGDGKAEVGVYLAGEWFIDLNGNGLWDDDDLWAKLGKKFDLPVVGDWDGDGKSDIGIYGPEWPGDSRAVAAEPGLPDAQNRNTEAAKNLPPRPEDATMGERWMKLTAAGQSREDVIDHVFYYGNAPDVPVAGDWNGDDVDTVGHFRNGRWRLDVDGTGKHSKHDVEFMYGQSGDRPVVGDFNRDGVDEVGVFRDGKWYIDTDGDRALTDRDLVIDFGHAGDQPVVEDFDADGEDELGVYHDGELDRREL